MSMVSDEIGPGVRVVLHIRVTLDDGMVAESTFDGEPVCFVVGDGTLIEGLERTLHGLRAGDRRHFRLGPEDAYGFSEPEAVHVLPRSDFPVNMELTPGLLIAFDTPSGESVPGMVLSVTDEGVEVDFNHPLAGRALDVEVEVLEIGQVVEH